MFSTAFDAITRWQFTDQASMSEHLKVCSASHKQINYCYITHKLQATNRVPRPVDRGTATRYGG